MRFARHKLGILDYYKLAQRAGRYRNAYRHRRWRNARTQRTESPDMIPDMLLWADGEWVKLIVPLVMFSIYALNRLFGGESAAARQAKARQQARANPPPPPADKQRVEDEVSEFLRRAAKQRGTAGQTRTPPLNQPPRPPAPQRKPLTSQARQDDLAAAENADGRPASRAPWPPRSPTRSTNAC